MRVHPLRLIWIISFPYCYPCFDVPPFTNTFYGHFTNETFPAQLVPTWHSKSRTIALYITYNTPSSIISTYKHEKTNRMAHFLFPWEYTSNTFPVHFSGCEMLNSHFCIKINISQNIFLLAPDCEGKSIIPSLFYISILISISSNLKIFTSNHFFDRQ